MSHFTTLKTQMVEKKYITLALEDMGYSYEEGDVQIRGFAGQQDQVEIRVPTTHRNYDIGFRKSGDAYEIVADWWGIKDIEQQVFQQQLSQRYAYHAARDKLEAQGFDLAAEEVQEDGQIRLVLRRMV